MHKEETSSNEGREAAALKFANHDPAKPDEKLLPVCAHHQSFQSILYLIGKIAQEKLFKVTQKKKNRSVAAKHRHQMQIALVMRDKN